MIIAYKGKMPKIAKNVFIAETAVIIGDVTIEEEANIWYGAVIRGDIAPIYIGKGTNIQDNAVIHVDEGIPCIIKKYVTVGHSATVHSATVEDSCLIGMGATVLTAAYIGRESIIGANALVTEHKKIPEKSLSVGIPAKVIRPLTEEEREAVHKNALHYTALAKNYIKK